MINQLYLCNNIPHHIAKSVKTFLSEDDVTVMEWPAQSPDMNSIENVWKLLNERAKEKTPSNVEELWINLKEEWEKISVEECNTLIARVAKDVKLLLKVKAYTNEL